MRTYLTAIALALGVAPTSAQQVQSPRVGEQMRVWAVMTADSGKAASRFIEGRVISIEDTRLVLASRHDTSYVPFRSIRSARAFRGQRPATAKGARIGAMIGLGGSAVVYILGVAVCGDFCSASGFAEYAPIGLVSTVFGAGVGAAVGSRKRVDRWERISRWPTAAAEPTAENIGYRTNK